MCLKWRWGKKHLWKFTAPITKRPTVPAFAITSISSIWLGHTFWRWIQPRVNSTTLGPVVAPVFVKWSTSREKSPDEVLRQWKDPAAPAIRRDWSRHRRRSNTNWAGTRSSNHWKQLSRAHGSGIRDFRADMRIEL